jgi:hypothetical protein
MIDFVIEPKLGPMPIGTPLFPIKRALMLVIKNIGNPHKICNKVKTVHKAYRSYCTIMIIKSNIMLSIMDSTMLYRLDAL